jgi:hypothetical protein
LGVALVLASCGTDGRPDPASVGGKADVPGGQPRLSGSCAGRCGGPGLGQCYCDTRCAELGDCCGDHQPLCVADGYPAASADDTHSLVFEPNGTAPRFRGEDFTGHSVRYSYRRLTDVHPGCVERLSDGGSAVRVVMEQWLTKPGSDARLGPVTERHFVSGFATSPTLSLPIDNTLSVQPDTDLHLRFHCLGFDGALDPPAGSHSVYITR